MRILIGLIILFSTSVFAEVSREEARTMIDEMVKSNMISAEEAEKAKARLINMNSQDWAAVNKDAEEKASRMPASVSSDEDQMTAIESDLKVIVPQVKVPMAGG